MRTSGRTIHLFYYVLLVTLVFLPTASADGVNKDVFRFGAAFFLFLALLPFILRLLRLDTRPWSREHRGLPPVESNEDVDTSEDEGPPASIFQTLNDVILRPFHPVFGIVGIMSVLIHGAIEGDCGRSTIIAMAVLLGYGLTGLGMRSGAPWVGDMRSNRMYHVSWLVALLLMAIIVMHAVL